MNNDSTPSDLPSSVPTTAPATDPRSASEAVPAGAVDDTSDSAAAVESQNVQPDSPVKKRARDQTRKKFGFINNLSLQLDVLIYVELCILYYMDCSLFRLLLRAINQMMFLSPKQKFVPAAPIHKPYIGAIFAPNFICILLHLFTERSSASESMRGYLHGGVIIDLIGQKGPTSKCHLVMLDLLILALQCFMLAVHVERERLSAVNDALASTSPTAATGIPREAVISAQSLDAEERGVLGESIATSEGDMELQLMPHAVSGDSPFRNENEADEGRNEERERLLAEPPAPQDDDDDGSLDVMWSGMAIVADFHILHNLRRQWLDYGNATESAIQTIGFSTAFAAHTASRRMNAASARFQRDVETLTS
ncbi:uncharacterized protein RSE6_08647 [Rhynchosporium secalis]|uniref:DUF1746 domain-containing protein n=1 Tax=Rhynchosporium secalis TaxID=38038 RepID=A0A1E1MG42_RHYSE|nr:uncharacterized protein RSE6_08647 [Rhynchosporium secalis]